MRGHRLDPGSAGLLFRHPHRRDLRIREDDAWNRSILRAHRSAEHVRTRNPSLVLADVRERHDAGHVADRPDPLSRTAALVHLDPPLSGLDTGALERQFAEAGLAADGDDQLVGTYLLLGEADRAAIPSGAHR